MHRITASSCRVGIYETRSRSASDFDTACVILRRALGIRGPGTHERRGT